MRDSDVTSLASHRAYATEAHLAGNNLYGHKDSEAQGKERLCSNGFSKDYGCVCVCAHARVCVVCMCVRADCAGEVG